MSYLALIGFIYMIVGIWSLTEVSFRRIGRFSLLLPVITFKWDKHGFCALSVGVVYLGVAAGILAH